MGIIANYWRVTPEQFAELQNDPQAAKAFFGFDLDSFHFSHPESMLATQKEKQSSENFFTLEKEWHALHCLLTGDLSLEEETQASPYWNVVMGGTPTQFEATYGFVRYLNPEEVREVAELLSAISVEELSQRFDVDAFNAAQIYPNPSPGGWEEEIEFLLEIYPEFVQFFQNAARQGDIVLLSSD
ncbi:YfbM family protein [Nostoc sp. FACHB-280]|uniref:YfbM family protein n=1 Tax=Nostoc sp. FACHB-280 TaxID=2692839 RepID=UPI00168BFF46|nr:YfbM family protein [Nostoc sp. FACHB-280]